MNVKRNIALFGCGAWGKNIARVLSELGALAVICDADGARGQSVASQHGVEFCGDVEAVLARGDIEGVAVATPAVTHAEVVLKALDAHKHVFVEKPIALSVDDARRMAARAIEVDRTLMVGHLLQYHPVFVGLLELVRGGRLGRVRYAYSNRLNAGRVRTEENALWSLAPHDFSMVLAVAGQAPSDVRAVGQAAVQHGIADLATIHLAFSRGLKAHIFCSWLSPYKEHRFVVIGENAMAVFDDSAQAWEDKLVVYHNVVTWKGGVPELVKGDAERIAIANSEPLCNEMSHFLDCVGGSQRPRTGPEEAIPVLIALAAAQRSLDQG